MAMFSRKIKIKKSGAPDITMPESSIESAPFADYLNQLRFVHLQESIDLANAENGVDPSAWPDGRINFEHEAATAKGHQIVRDNLQREFLRKSGSVGSLDKAARAVVKRHSELQESNNVLTGLNERLRRARKAIDGDSAEEHKLSNLQNPNYQNVKILIVVLFVLSELLLTGNFMANGVSINLGLPPTLNNDLPYIVSGGILVLLVAIPHYLAKGLKIIESHSDVSLSTDGEEAAIAPNASKRDVTVLRIGIAVLGALLIALILAITYFRTQAVFQWSHWIWFVLFFCIQSGLSSYFFVREWIDFGVKSSDVYILGKQCRVAGKRRDKSLDRLNAAILEYRKDASPLYAELLSLPRQDSAIIEAYNETILLGRHILTVQFPELAPFIDGARVPYLDSFSEIDDKRGTVYEPTSNSNRTSESDDIRGRQFWINKLAELIKSADNLDQSLVMFASDLALRDLREYQRTMLSQDVQEQ